MINLFKDLIFSNDDLLWTKEVSKYKVPNIYIIKLMAKLSSREISRNGLIEFLENLYKGKPFLHIYDLTPNELGEYGEKLICSKVPGMKRIVEDQDKTKKKKKKGKADVFMTTLLGEKRKLEVKTTRAFLINSSKMFWIERAMSIFDSFKKTMLRWGHIREEIVPLILIAIYYDKIRFWVVPSRLDIHQLLNKTRLNEYDLKSSWNKKEDFIEIMNKFEVEEKDLPLAIEKVLKEEVLSDPIVGLKPHNELFKISKIV